jgi:hypothetical protein
MEWDGMEDAERLSPPRLRQSLSRDEGWLIFIGVGRAFAVLGEEPG